MQPFRHVIFHALIIGYIVWIRESARKNIISFDDSFEKSTRRDFVLNVIVHGEYNIVCDDGKRGKQNIIIIMAKSKND